MSQNARERGFALLIVLWSMVLLAMIGTRIAAAGRTETQLAANMRASAIAEAAADGAVFLAVFHLLDGSGERWFPDGRPHEVKLPTAVVNLTIVDERRKLTLNTSSPILLRTLLQSLGWSCTRPNSWPAKSQTGAARENVASSLGAKELQYREAGRAYGPPNEPFRSIDELALVLHITSALLEQLRPYVSPTSTPHPTRLARIL